MPKPHKVASKGPSQRQLRVGELVRHAIADVLTRAEVPEAVFKGHLVTIPEVRMSPDLKLATAYVVSHGRKDVAAVVEALNRSARPLRGALSGRVELKFMPQLRFMADTSFDEGARIDALLRSPEVRRDVDSLDDRETGEDGDV